MKKDKIFKRKIWFKQFNEWKYHWDSFSDFSDAILELKDNFNENTVAIIEKWETSEDEGLIVLDKFVGIEFVHNENHRHLSYFEYDLMTYFSPGLIFNQIKKNDKFYTFEEFTSEILPSFVYFGGD